MNVKKDDTITSSKENGWKRVKDKCREKTPKRRTESSPTPSVLKHVSLPAKYQNGGSVNPQTSETLRIAYDTRNSGLNWEKEKELSESN